MSWDIWPRLYLLYLEQKPWVYMKTFTNKLVCSLKEIYLYFQLFVTATVIRSYMKYSCSCHWWHYLPQANNTQLTRKEREMWNITTKALLHLGVILVVDVFFHYLYILTIPSDMKLVTKLSDWCLGEWINSYLIDLFYNICSKCALS